MLHWKYLFRACLIVLALVLNFNASSALRLSTRKNVVKNELDLFGEDNSNRSESDFLGVNTHIRRRRSLIESIVRMPTGQKYYTYEPQAGTDDCSQETKLLTLNKHGKYTKREYEIVADQMEKSKIDIPNCEARGGCVKRFKILKIQKLINGCMWSAYRDQKKVIEETDADDMDFDDMLFYGTHDALDIVEKGFDERLSSRDRTWGAGIYFVRHSNAANEYAYGPKIGSPCPSHSDPACTICTRRMILARVALGKKKFVNGTLKVAHAPVGYNSVLGKQDNNIYTEYVVYRGEQAYPEYMISYKIRTMDATTTAKP